MRQGSSRSCGRPTDRSLDSPGREAADRPNRAETSSRSPAPVPVRAGRAWPPDPSIHMSIARMLADRLVPTHRPGLPGPPPRSRLGRCRETTKRSASPRGRPLTTPLAAARCSMHPLPGRHRSVPDLDASVTRLLDRRPPPTMGSARRPRAAGDASQTGRPGNPGVLGRGPPGKVAWPLLLKPLPLLFPSAAS